MTTQLTLPKWYDLHVHLRQGPSIKAFIQSHLDMGCAGVLAMPNTKPPVIKVLESDNGDGWSIEAYLEMLKEAGGDRFSDIIVPLYLTGDASADMIAAGAKTNILRACKYYPPHGTTGAQEAAPLETYIENGVFAAMEEAGIVLCIHGEEHGQKAEEYFDQNTNAEEVFYQTRMPVLTKKFPKLKIVCEHITTKTTVDFVKQSGPNVVATVTPQHLLYTVGHLVKGFRYHLYCLPVVKFEQDRQALRDAVTEADNTKFFAGTDSAPHTHKATECGCAAGCFTGGIAPQLYAQAFERAGMNLDEDHSAFQKFLCENGANFYELDIPKETFTLERKEQIVEMLDTPDGPITPLPLGMKDPILPWSIRLQG